MGSYIYSMRNFARVTKRFFDFSESKEKKELSEEEKERIEQDKKERFRESVESQSTDLSDLFADENSKSGFDNFCKQVLIKTPDSLLKIPENYHGTTAELKNYVFDLLAKREKLCERFKELRKSATELSKPDHISNGGLPIMSTIKFFADLGLITPKLVKNWAKGLSEKSADYALWGGVLPFSLDFIKGSFKNPEKLTKAVRAAKALKIIPHALKEFFLFEAVFTPFALACLIACDVHSRDKEAIEKCDDDLTRCYFSMVSVLHKIDKIECRILEILDLDENLSTVALLQKFSKEFLNSYYTNIYSGNSAQDDFDAEEAKKHQKEKHKNLSDFFTGFLKANTRTGRAHR